MMKKKSTKNTTKKKAAKRARKSKAEACTKLDGSYVVVVKPRVPSFSSTSIAAMMASSKAR